LGARLSRIALSLRSLELKPVAGPLEVREQGSVAGTHNPVKEEMLDTDVIVEILQVDELAERQARVEVDPRAAVQGEG
jgi:hypothetical protein